MASFSSQTKIEAARVAVKSACCRRAELLALTRFCGVIGISRAGLNVTLGTSLEPVAQRILSLIQKVYGFDCDIRRVEREQLNRHARMQISITGQDAKRLLLDCGMLHADSQDALSFEEGWNAHMTQRRERSVVYVKEFECIAQFLAHIGAHAAYLHMEDARMLREIKNEVNRSVNCSTANIKKTTDAAAKQIRAILLLEREGVLRGQPLGVRQTAEMRLEYPEASLDELAQMSNVSRSGINHRLRRLVQLAQALGGEDA